jgi:Family of unknown function (DUF5996)
MPSGAGRTIEMAFFVAHRFVVSVRDGDVEFWPLADGMACMDFTGQLFAALRRLGVDVKIHPAPFDLDEREMLRVMQRLELMYG